VLLLAINGSTPRLWWGASNNLQNSGCSR